MSGNDEVSYKIHLPAPLDPYASWPIVDPPALVPAHSTVRVRARCGEHERLVPMKTGSRAVTITKASLIPVPLLKDFGGPAVQDFDPDLECCEHD